jgi:hypothetical protein
MFAHNLMCDINIVGPALAGKAVCLTTHFGNRIGSFPAKAGPTPVPLLICSSVSRPEAQNPGPVVRVRQVVRLDTKGFA